MFRVGRHFPISVVAPTPWFPFQDMLRRIKPHFRPGAPTYERQSGIDVWYPRFLSIPSLLKTFDGLMMALGAFSHMRRLKHEGRLDIIDAHFAYPDGYAASLLSRWLEVPFTITLRGTETRHIHDARLGKKLLQAIKQAAQVFSVSESLRTLVISHGAPPDKIEVVGNGVDAIRFSVRDRTACRTALCLSRESKVLVSVGGLVPRKGFHRVIELLPKLRQQFPDLIFLIIGGGSTEGNNRVELENQVKRLNLEGCVRFLGSIASDELPSILSAADVFVLATSNEGWANVFLEAMACGLPVVTTAVGGNQEVVCEAGLGTVVPFGDSEALAKAIKDSFIRSWDRAYIRSYAEKNSWDERVTRLCQHFLLIAQGPEGQHE
ncbi:glycosyltransferase [Propionivibrio sp.]|uniref:glycosyltransferase n=1 Tax=Propionivibrio sp. TaxID=2212460 RepID=UPI0025ECD09A|nr:glycosyltransferase [Propionivibrio sp.]